MPTYFLRPLTLLEAVRAGRLIAVVTLRRWDDVSGEFEGFEGRRYWAEVDRGLRVPEWLGSFPLLVLRGRELEEGVEAPKVHDLTDLPEGLQGLLFAVRWDGRRDFDHDGEKVDYVPYLNAFLPVSDGMVDGGGAIDLGDEGAVDLDRLVAEVERLIEEVDREDEELAKLGEELPRPVEAEELEPPGDALDPPGGIPSDEEPGPEEMKLPSDGERATGAS
jgi:hypothetical protein